MTRIVILTGSELRHAFFRTAIASKDGITVLRSSCEGVEKSLRTLAQSKPAATATLELRHVDARDRAERDFFGLFVESIADRSKPLFLKKGKINDRAQVNAVKALLPDLIVAYGCSIIREDLLDAFPRRILNVHLGLSPYYRGAGTNFWPFANDEPEYAGATFMWIDAGVDTGEIIHQMRPRIFPDDSIHRIGTRLIGDMTAVYADIIRSAGDLTPMTQPAAPGTVKVYRKSEFGDAAIKTLRQNFDSGMIERYLSRRDERCAAVPIVQNPLFVESRPRP